MNLLNITKNAVLVALSVAAISATAQAATDIRSDVPASPKMIAEFNKKSQAMFDSLDTNINTKLEMKAAKVVQSYELKVTVVLRSKEGEVIDIVDAGL